MPLPSQQGLPVFLTNDWPSACVPLVSGSGNLANASAVATLAAAVGLTTYLNGFFILAGGATLGLLVNCTISGLVGGTLTFPYAAVAGVLLLSAPIFANFSPGLPAAAPNTAIVVTLPPLGTGNTNAAVFAWGYQL